MSVQLGLGTAAAAAAAGACAALACAFMRSIICASAAGAQARIARVERRWKANRRSLGSSLSAAEDTWVSMGPFLTPYGYSRGSRASASGTCNVLRSIEHYDVGKTGHWKREQRLPLARRVRVRALSARRALDRVPICPWGDCEAWSRRTARRCYEEIPLGLWEASGRCQNRRPRPCAAPACRFPTPTPPDPSGSPGDGHRRCRP